jgi:GPH family glycoside/pentoside/hexuronide:cation symporter
LETQFWSNILKTYPTAAADRIPVLQRLAYGSGALVNNLLAAAMGMMAIVLNLGLGMNPALVGLLMALPRLTDALTDPLMGYISDHTRSRWGRRRPYIFAGAVMAGVVFALLWQLPAGHSESFYFWFFLCGSFVFYVGYTIFATPWVALGYEMTPDYNERTRLMGVANFMGQIAYVVVPWFYMLMENERLFEDSVAGARALAIGVGIFTICVGIIPAIFCRERMKSVAVAELVEQPVAAVSFLKGLWKNVTGFFRGFLITIRFAPFLKLCIATFLVFNGFMLIASFGSYVIIYYLYEGDKFAGGKLMGWVGTASAVGTFVVIPIVTWVSTRIGKRKAFFFAIGVSIFGYILKWFCYQPSAPMLLLVCTPFIAFGLGGLFTLMPSMVADVCDLDELETHNRREGMFGSIFWWVVKLGMALALALSGVMLNATGFDVALEGNQAASTLMWMRLLDVGVPVLTSIIAIWVVASYPITEQSAREVRDQLEARRGKA